MAQTGIDWISVFADVPDPLFEREAAYWQAITAARAGEPQGAHGEFLPLRPDGGGPVLWLQSVSRDEPSWHLDLYPADLEVAVSQAIECGAQVVRQGAWWTSLASPGGMPFCLTRLPDPRPQVPRAVSWPGGHRSEFDQLCLDIPDAIYDSECAFWSALTGWPCRPGDLAEFAYLTRPAGIGVRLLLQRLGPDDPRGVRAHPDLACDDRAAETTRHTAAGGIVTHTADEWTVLRDPAGLVYCITDRRPRA